MDYFHALSAYRGSLSNNWMMSVFLLFIYYMLALIKSVKRRRCIFSVLCHLDKTKKRLTEFALSASSSDVFVMQ